jgi:hypothetical protein
LHPSFDILRTGKKYVLKNFGDVYEFIVLDAMADGDFQLKDIHTLEVFQLSDVIRYGKGKDFDLFEHEE